MQFQRVPAGVMSTSRRKAVYGVGINDAPYATRDCPIFNQWKAMLQRSLCPKWKAKYPCYESTKVAPEWLTFSNFLAWVDAQDAAGFVLDKDLRIPGNKTYGPDTCLMIPQEINKLVIRAAEKESDLPVGVGLLKGRYLARMRAHGKPVSLGMHATAEEAHATFLAAKTAHVREVANQQYPLLREALHRVADSIESGAFYA